MATLTDPAKELAEILKSLQEQDHAHGDMYLAKKFGVDPWTNDFFQIVSCIFARSEFIISSFNTMIDDDEVRLDAERNIRNSMRAFNRESMSTPWQMKGLTFITEGNVSAIRMLSVGMRKKYAYPSLTDDEVKEIVALIAELREWLMGHQLQEQDFIRQLIIDGINNLEFRLNHIRWVGWGYAVQSLRDVIGAYFALESGIIDPNNQPMEQAIIHKVASFVQSFYEKAKFAKDITSTADFMIKMYGMVSLAVSASKAAPALLTFVGS